MRQMKSRGKARRRAQNRKDVGIVARFVVRL